MREHSREILYYNVYGAKAVGGEIIVNDKGFMRRCIPIFMIKAKPKRRLSKITKEDFKRLRLLRSELLLWKLKGGFESSRIAEIDLSEMESLGELWEPLLVASKGTIGEPDLKSALHHAHIRKLQDSKTSFEGYLAIALMELRVTEEFNTFKFIDIWDRLLTVMNAEMMRGKNHIMISDDFGEITKNSVGLRLKSAFGGLSKTKRFEKVTVKVYEFDKGLLTKTLERYKKVTELLKLLGFPPSKENKEGRGVHSNLGNSVTIPNALEESSNSVTESAKDLFKEFEG